MKIDIVNNVEKILYILLEKIHWKSNIFVRNAMTIKNFLNHFFNLISYTKSQEPILRRALIFCLKIEVVEERREFHMNVE